MPVEELFSVIAERTRRDILEALAKEHKAVGELVEELGVSQPTVSKHLRVLREAGVVTMQAQGQKRFYSINTKPLSLVSAWLDGLGAGITAAPHATATHATAQRSGTPRIAATPAATAGVPSVPTPAAPTPAAPAVTAAPTTPATPAVTGAPAAAAAVVLVGGEHEGTVQQQITRSVGRAANKAADLLANLPTFRRRKD
ncbi:DNA-binding transcriptional ArsR family regulator [Arthrobacter silviterrae]|uniref:Winged helix-turn-helix transcriptional regulator n=1 Tax=Arthrobacter silviterrae TaxID=2026658 RepID=A0ABX0DH84_9MICC|nr:MULTISPECIES: metalloregulator ArsR/SmtB family transcription factor [Arthrobacter]MCU6478902.1 metalloregulator ArsR/SmtB family transcription factor [Arthrobacter sp. A2-55]MDQ0277892.1 DNA-binding transcriptional ArsR family regulator [Arthrobacter silviterrae]NGN84729.1 winged helix-turn-helix transcriptional regulator [Arthrobacter silviterrae]